MGKRTVRGILSAAVLALVLGAGTSRAQSKPDQPPLYTYVAQWGVPRAQWGDMASGSANAQATFDKLIADGTITGWGIFEYIVHDQSGFTHGDWWQATNLADIVKARDALIANPQSKDSPLNNAKHVDYLLRNVAYGGKKGAGGTGILWVAGESVKPGQVNEFINIFKKEIQPFFEQQVAEGNVTYYSLDEEVVHTDAPGSLHIAYVLPNAAALDKFHAALHAVGEKNPLFGPAFSALTKGEAHRDLFAKVTAYTSK